MSATKTEMKDKSNVTVLAKKFSLGTFEVSQAGKVQVAFDLSRAPVPKETYAASHVSVTAGPSHDLFLTFYQIDAESKAVRHKIEIKFDDLAILNAWANSKDFFTRTKKWYLDSYGEEMRSSEFKSAASVPAYQLTSNMLFLGHSESSAVAVFYYFDPRAARQLALGGVPDKDLVATPVVQIKLTTPVLIELLSQIEVFVGNLINRYPKLSDKLARPQKATENE